MGDLKNINLLNKVRQLVETDYCKDRGLASDIDPLLIRLVHRVPDRSQTQDFSDIRNRGDTTDEEEAKAAKSAEEEKKGEPDEEIKEEEKKELAEEEDKEAPKEEDKKSPENAEAKAKKKAAKQAKLKSVKDELQKMKIATIWNDWRQYAFNEKEEKAMTEDEKTKLKKVKDALNKPKKSKIFKEWKPWAQKHSNDRKLSWEQTLQQARPISCFNDISVTDVYAEILNIFDQAQLRFAWTFVQVFNKYFTTSIRFINQSNTPISVPIERAQPMTIGAYLNSAKDICMAKAKNDLKYLILTRTAIAADESGQLPKITFTRLKDASGSGNDEKEKVKVKPSFIQAFEQVKNMDPSVFR